MQELKTQQEQAQQKILEEKQLVSSTMCMGGCLENDA